MSGIYLGRPGGRYHNSIVMDGARIWVINKLRSGQGSLWAEPCSLVAWRKTRTSPKKTKSSKPGLVPRHFDTEFMSLKKKITDLTSYQSQCCFDNWCKLQLYDEVFRLMLTMRGRNSIWWPPTANCGIERLGLEATPTWPAVVLLANYDPHYSVLQPGSVSRPGWGHPAITQLSNYGTIINGTAGRWAHQSTSTAHIPQDHSGHLSWHPASSQPAPKYKAK